MGLRNSGSQASEKSGACFQPRS